MSINYKSILGLKIFKSVIDLFISTFFVMYFLNLSNDNLVALAIYYLILYFTFLVLGICINHPKEYIS